MKLHKGFTLIETAISITFVALIAALLVIQKFNLDAMNRDNIKKTAVNTIYYALENDFYLRNGFYPESISADNLTVVAPELLETDYVYIPANCTQGHCQEYTLTIPLEKEPTYVRANKSRS